MNNAIEYFWLNYTYIYIGEYYLLVLINIYINNHPNSIINISELAINISIHINTIKNSCFILFYSFLVYPP